MKADFCFAVGFQTAKQRSNKLSLDEIRELSLVS